MSATSHIFQKIATLLKLLIINMLLLSSCLKENMTVCPEQIRVYFSFTTVDTYTGEGDDPINPDDVDRMRLYVFSEKGYYLGVYRDDHITGFSTEYYMDCSDLLPGNYRFIAWSGMDENFYGADPEQFVQNQTTFDEALMMLKHSGNLISTPVHHIFHSELPATVTYAKVQRFDMPLAQVSNTVHISTVGLPADDCAYRFNIADNNDKYYFDRSFASNISDATFTYTASCTKDGAQQLHSTLNVLRLAADRHTPVLQIYNETDGKTLYPFGAHSGDLIGLIKNAYPQNDFDQTHTYHIVLVFNGDPDDATRFTVTIFINGWEVREQNNELI